LLLLVFADGIQRRHRVSRQFQFRRAKVFAQMFQKWMSLAGSK